MTPLECVELIAVETALHAARMTVNDLRVRNNEDGMDWTRYLWSLSDQLGFRGLNGVR